MTPLAIVFAHLLAEPVRHHAVAGDDRRPSPGWARAGRPVRVRARGAPRARRRQRARRRASRRVERARGSIPASEDRHPRNGGVHHGPRGAGRSNPSLSTRASPGATRAERERYESGTRADTRRKGETTAPVGLETVAEYSRNVELPTKSRESCGNTPRKPSARLGAGYPVPNGRGRAGSGRGRPSQELQETGSKRRLWRLSIPGGNDRKDPLHEAVLAWSAAPRPA